MFVKGSSLVVQGLRPCTSNAGGMGSNPGQGNKSPHAAWCGKKKKKNHTTQTLLNKLEQKFLAACLHSTWLQPLQHLYQKLVKFLYSVLVKFSDNINVGQGNQNPKRRWQTGAMKWNIWEKIKSWVEILRKKMCFTSTGLACQSSLWTRKGNLVDPKFNMCWSCWHD